MESAKLQYSSILAVQKYTALECITVYKMQWKCGLSHQMIDKDDNWSKSHKDHDFYNIKGVTIYKLQWWGEGARNSPLFNCWTSTCNCRCQLKDAMIVPMVMWHPADREDIGEADLTIRCQVLTSPQKEVSRVARGCHTKIGRQITMATRRNGWRWPCEWRLVWQTLRSGTSEGPSDDLAVWSLPLGKIFTVVIIILSFTTTTIIMGVQGNIWCKVSGAPQHWERLIPSCLQFVICTPLQQCHLKGIKLQQRNTMH